jgi:hypothetical protein
VGLVAGHCRLYRARALIPSRACRGITVWYRCHAHVPHCCEYPTASTVATDMQLYSTTPSALDWTAYLAGKDPAWKGQAAAAAVTDKGGVCCRKASDAWAMGCAVCCWRGRVVGHLSGFQAPAIYGFGSGPTRLAGILVSLSPSKTNIRTLTVTLRPIRFLGSVTRDDNLLPMSGTCGGVEQAIPHVSTTNQHGSQQTVGPGRRKEGRRRQTPNSCCWWRQREAPGVSTTY